MESSSVNLLYTCYFNLFCTFRYISYILKYILEKLWPFDKKYGVPFYAGFVCQTVEIWPTPTFPSQRRQIYFGKIWFSDILIFSLLLLNINVRFLQRIFICLNCKMYVFKSKNVFIYFAKIIRRLTQSSHQQWQCAMSQLACSQPLFSQSHH